MSLNAKVKVYLQKHNIKKKDFAEYLDVSAAMLSHWFAGRVIFPPRTIQKINEFLNNKSE
jgi:DNA-binding transcriptional regulator YiaG